MGRVADLLMLLWDVFLADLLHSIIYNVYYFVLPINRLR